MGGFSCNASFFEHQKGGSFNSARQIVPFVISLVHPCSVLDVGCGVGPWLAVFLEHKVEEHRGSRRRLCGPESDDDFGEPVCGC